jgi:DNA-binding transcriptional ArsR family regulator
MAGDLSLTTNPILDPPAVLDPPGMQAAPVDLFADDDDIERASRSLKAISHPLRLKILCTLGGQEVSVQEIVDFVGTSQSNISQHLAILRDKGILASRKDANRVYYRVTDTRTLQLIGMMREVFCHHGR